MPDDIRSVPGHENHDLGNGRKSTDPRGRRLLLGKPINTRVRRSERSVRCKLDVRVGLAAKKDRTDFQISGHALSPEIPTRNLSRISHHVERFVSDVRVASGGFAPESSGEEQRRG